MTDVCLGFEVHQPLRVRNNFYWDSLEFQPVPKKGLLDYYFDFRADREIFTRAAEKCYLPSSSILLEQIDHFKRGKNRFKFALSISGVWLEQCERWSIDLLDLFRQLSGTGCVEFLEQTYYHSLSSLWPDRDEWIEQIQMHRNKMKELLGVEPRFFENTEFLYNNAIAETVEKLGYNGIMTEGIERILGGRSPNFVYSPRGCKKIRVLMRNYRLTDDFGFRFSARSWPEWPLTADKFARWLSSTPGQCINLFADYETFGEHHWPESGIHEFLRHLPEVILNYENLDFGTPSEIVEKHQPMGEIDANELGNTVSWADTERDTSCWLGNTLQWAYYEAVKRIGPLVKESRDADFLQVWRDFQISDHLYYMYIGEGGPGEVHRYFSPYGSSYDAFVTCITAILDFTSRLKDRTVAGAFPFVFKSTRGETEIVRSLFGFLNVLGRVDQRTFESHLRRGDISRWFEQSLFDPILAESTRRFEHLSTDSARVSIFEAVKKRYQDIVGGQRFETKLPRREITSTPPRIEMACRILRKMPSWKTFWFYEDAGKATDWAASSLSEFLERIGQVSAASIAFHASRSDFEIWIRDAVHDSELAEKVKQISSLQSEELRRKLILLISSRIEELSNMVNLAI